MPSVARPHTAQHDRLLLSCECAHVEHAPMLTFRSQLYQEFIHHVNLLDDNGNHCNYSPLPAKFVGGMSTTLPGTKPLSKNAVFDWKRQFHSAVMYASHACCMLCMRTNKEVVSDFTHIKSIIERESAVSTRHADLAIATLSTLRCPISLR